MRRIDVNRAGIRPNQGFESGEIMSPAVLRLAPPFADGGPGAFGNGERAFVAGRFDNGVVGGREQRVIEEEDGFFGGRNNDQLIGTDLGVDRG